MNVRSKYTAAPRLRAQRGALLISALIMVIVFGTLMTMWAQMESTRTRNMRADAIGDALAVLGDQLDTYIRENHKAILDESSVVYEVAGSTRHIANARVLQVGELIQWSRVRGVGDQPPYMANAQYKIQIELDPPNCVQSSTNQGRCKIKGLLYIDQPIALKGKPNVMLAARAAAKIGRNGGYSSPVNPDEIKFGDSNYRNNATALPRLLNPKSGEVGILARRAGSAFLSLSEDYLPRDGSKPMEGRLNMLSSSGIRGNVDGVNRLNSVEIDTNGLLARTNINASWNIHAGRRISAGDGIKAGGDIESDGLIKSDSGVEARYVWAKNARGDQPSGMQPANGNRGGDLYASEAIRAGGNIHTDGFLRVADKIFLSEKSDVKKGDPCAVDKPHFIRSGNQILVCQDGRYGPAGQLSMACQKKNLEFFDTYGGSLDVGYSDQGECDQIENIQPIVVRYEVSSKANLFRGGAYKKAKLGEFRICAIVNDGDSYYPGDASDRHHVGYDVYRSKDDDNWYAGRSAPDGYPMFLRDMVVECFGPPA